MTIATFIKDNTDDCRNIVRLLIDVMNGDIEGCTLSHRLAAARLLTVYGSESAVAGQDDAPDFIADNTPDASETESGRKIWLEIDPGLRTLIKARTDDGRVICMFLIDVMEGRVEGIHVGHRVSAAKELLNRAFGKSLDQVLASYITPSCTPPVHSEEPDDSRTCSVPGHSQRDAYCSNKQSWTNPSSSRSLKRNDEFEARGVQSRKQMHRPKLRSQCSQPQTMSTSGTTTAATT